MRVFSIISEYNPYHNGHKFLTDYAKANGADAVVAIMGGNFLQRGEPAIADKFTRARCALEGGVDLVLELPSVYAVASAERFAYGGVSVANALGCVDTLIFGSEAGDTEKISTVASALLDNSFTTALKSEMQRGFGYAASCEKAAKSVLGADLASILSTPNNVLGVEYIKSLIRTKSKIKPLAVFRKGAQHNSVVTSNDIASASFIRNNMTNADVFKFMPNSIKRILESSKTFPATIENGEKAVLYKLRTMRAEDFMVLPDVTEGLENRLISAVQKATSVSEIVSMVCTKRYTNARINRIIMCAFLGITADMQNSTLPYIRVLGFNENGLKVLSIAKKTANLPVITKVSSGLKLLDKSASDMLLTDIKANDLFSIFSPETTPCGDDYYIGHVRI